MEKELKSLHHWASIHLNEEELNNFIANVENQKCEDELISLETETIERFFIGAAFIWENSKEGHDYWKNIQFKVFQKNGWS